MGCSAQVELVPIKFKYVYRCLTAHKAKVPFVF